MFGLYVWSTVVAETGTAPVLGHVDVDISEAGEVWGDEDIMIDEGLMATISDVL